MKIDTDLRLAIKSAEKAQPSISWQDKEANRKASIAGFLKSNKAAARDIAKLTAIIVKSDKAKADAQAAMCKRYGLVTGGKEISFAGCGEGTANFTKAGGQIINTDDKWSFDSVMRQLVIATPKEGAAILKRLGINWS